MSRPGGIRLLSGLAVFGGAVEIAFGAVLAAGAFEAGQLTGGTVVAAVLIVALGVLRIATSFGLSALRPWARSAELVSAWLWLAGYAAMIGYAAWRLRLGDISDELAVLGLLTPGAVIAVAELHYLRRAAISERFTPEAEDDAQGSGRGRQLAHAAATLALLVFFLALAVPNARNAGTRSATNRAMKDIRTIGTAVEAYATDHKAYPNARSVEELVPILSPTYIRRENLPLRDPWNTPYRYEVRKGEIYRIGSAAKGSKWERDLWAYPTPEPGTWSGETEAPEEDLVYENGSFIRYPQARSAG